MKRPYDDAFIWIIAYLEVRHLYWRCGKIYHDNSREAGK